MSTAGSQATLVYFVFLSLCLNTLVHSNSRQFGNTVNKVRSLVILNANLFAVFVRFLWATIEITLFDFR